MKHTLLTFRLHLRGVVLAALGALLAAALLLVGGCLLGQWRAGRAAAAPETAAGGTVRVAGAAGAGAMAGGSGPGSGAPPTTSAAEPPPGMPARYALRVGAFSTEEDAKALADRLTQRGYAPTLGEVQGSTGATLHLVFVGSYGALWEARGAAGEIERREAREGLQAVVVPAPQ